MAMDMGTSLRHQLVRRIVERGGQTASTLFDIRDNKRNVGRLLKKSLNAIKLIQHRFHMFQHGWKRALRRWGGGGGGV